MTKFVLKNYYKKRKRRKNLNKGKRAMKNVFCVAFKIDLVFYLIASK